MDTAYSMYLYHRLRMVAVFTCCMSVSGERVNWHHLQLLTKKLYLLFTDTLDCFESRALSAVLGTHEYGPFLIKINMYKGPLLLFFLISLAKGLCREHNGNFHLIVQRTKSFSLQLCLTKLVSVAMLVTLTHLMFKKNLKIN